MRCVFSNLYIQIALALSAASALIYEVIATDVLFFYFIESTYSIATVLSVFLFGLGIGSLSIYFLSPKIKNKKILFGALQIFISLYAFFVLININSIVDKISTFGTFFSSFILLLIPTMFLGAIFPLASEMFKNDNRDSVGLIYSSDLFGAIFGSLIAGFLLIPLYGHKIAVVFAGFLNLISAFIILPKKGKLIPIILLVLALILVNFSNPVLGEAADYDFYSNSPYGIVKVQSNSLFINERLQCSTDYGNVSEKLMADYAINSLHQKQDLNVLNIGLGCGLTAARALTYGAEVDVVEINPQVVEANKFMSDILKNDKINLIMGDGLKYLRESDKEYDVILVDVENPSIMHSSNLYTVEAFKIIENSLGEDSTFALWHYDRANRKNMDILFYSLKESFRFVYSYPNVFLASNKQLSESGSEYVPEREYEINTINRKTLDPVLY